MRPVIAIVGDALTDPSPVINLNNADMAPNMIKNALIKCGALPIILPFPEQLNQAASLSAQAVSLFDGLLLPGGPDVDPTLYGEEPLPALGEVLYPEDVFELKLTQAAIKSGKPILAICRGMQVLNVACGGDLYQDLAVQDPNYAIRHAQAAPGQYPTHHVQMRAGSRLEQLLGAKAYVNSRHHQAVRRLGQGLTITATAADGVIEGIESSAGNQLLGVQWHPENLWPNDPDQLMLFADLVKRASANQ